MTTAYDAPHDELDDGKWNATRIGLGLIIVASIAMWAWIFLFAPRNNPDRFESRNFSEAAERICAPIQVEINALPPGHRAATPQDRAAQVASGTILTQVMVDELRAAAEAVTDPDELTILDAWFEDWDAYIGDREAHFDKLIVAEADADDISLVFTLSPRAAGGAYTRRIDGLANVNDMASCHVPLDV